VDTSLYISAADGQVLERRNNHWRVSDFFWMLHIMDYAGRSNFNNALVITVALIAIWLGLSGLMLLSGSFSRHDFYFFDIFRPATTYRVTLVDRENKPLQQLHIRQGAILFLALADQGVELPSICGGGGECGKCRVKIQSGALPEPNPTEQGLIPAPLRKQGFRLACQQRVTGSLWLQLP
jgi:ferredoxin